MVHRLEINCNVQVFQLASNRADLFCVLHVLPLPPLRRQFDGLPGQKVGENAVVTNGLLDLVEAPLESTHSAHSNVVFSCAASVLVLDSGVLAKDVATADSVNLVAGIAVLIFVSVEPEGVSALDILLLHPFGRNGNAKKSSEEAMDLVGGIVAADMAHKGWSCQPLRDGLTPFHDSILNLILQKKRENLLGDLVGSIGGG